MRRPSQNVWLAALHLGVTVLVCGCGGGGGGGGNNDPSTSALSFSAIPASLAFLGTDGSSVEPPTQQIFIQSSGGTVYVDVTYAGIAYEATFLQISGATVTATVRVPAPRIVGAGVHTGSVTIRGYEYAFSGSPQVAGSPHEVNVTYSVSGLATNPAGILVFNQAQAQGGTLPGAQVITLSDGLNSADSYSWSATVDYTPITGLIVPTWLQVSQLSGSTLPVTLTVSVVVKGQPGIVYDGYINITAVNGYTKSIHVIYQA